jgi:putative transposase
MKGSAKKFLNKAIGNNGKPRLINIDKSGAYKSGVRSINRDLMMVKKIRIRQCKYLNNIVEQDPRNIKRRISIGTGVKEFESTQRTLAGVEAINIIRKGQIAGSSKTTFKIFCSLAV